MGGSVDETWPSSDRICFRERLIDVCDLVQGLWNQGEVIEE